MKKFPHISELFVFRKNKKHLILNAFEEDYEHLFPLFKDEAVWDNFNENTLSIVADPNDFSGLKCYPAEIDKETCIKTLNGISGRDAEFYVPEEDDECILRIYIEDIALSAAVEYLKIQWIKMTPQN